MSLFRPCIDLHEGKVKQIVGGSLRDDATGLRTNFVSGHGAGWYAAKYREDGLEGGHVIMLGPGNREAALEALGAWPGGLQVGGGITLENAGEWLGYGAGKVIVTSWLFDAAGKFQWGRLEELSREVGRERLVVDLSCRRVGGRGEGEAWAVAMNRWQTLTDFALGKGTEESLDRLAGYCSELLVHAADVEGLCGGVDGELVDFLGGWGKLAVTYAGGVGGMSDLEEVERRSGGKVDVTVGSALDIFGGSGVKYGDLVEWNRRRLG